MLLSLVKRFVFSTDPGALARFSWNFGLKSLLSIERFKRQSRRGLVFPPVMFLSITSRCNLRCLGCWVSVDGPVREMPVADVDRIIRQCKRRGNYFFGLLGGEPTLHPGLWEILSRHSDCYFQLLTNGTTLTAETAARMRRLGNVTPLISIEGLAASGDQRRGGREIYSKALAAVEHCRRQGLLIGIASSICRSNIDELATEDFLRELIARGVHYVWYYIYRPVGPRPSAELALGGEQIDRLREFIVQARTRLPILIVDAYWDEQGRAMCPAASGISHHVSPEGDVEPCPPIQFARDSAVRGPIYPTIVGSAFLKSFRSVAAETTRGCILLEQPGRLREFLIEQQGRDTSGRGSGLAELAAAAPCPGHHRPGREIPERHWMYRLAKRYWFFGFGAYG